MAYYLQKVQLSLEKQLHIIYTAINEHGKINKPVRRLAY
jgi:hypothetical protein